MKTESLRKIFNDDNRGILLLISDRKFKLANKKQNVKLTLSRVAI